MAYLDIKNNLGKLSKENQGIQDDTKSKDELTNKLGEKFGGLKKDFLAYLAQQKRKSKAKVRRTARLEIGDPFGGKTVRVRPSKLDESSQSHLNEIWLEKNQSVRRLASDYMELIKQKVKGIPVEEGHIRILSNKQKKFSMQMKNPVLIESRQESSFDRLAEIFESISL